mgnify:CR=1 FL=1
MDTFRLRRLVGDNTAHRALRRDLGQPRPGLARLGDIARELRASTSVRTALRVLEA